MPRWLEILAYVQGALGIASGVGWWAYWQYREGRDGQDHQPRPDAWLICVLIIFVEVVIVVVPLAFAWAWLTELPKNIGRDVRERIAARTGGKAAK